MATGLTNVMPDFISFISFNQNHAIREANCVENISFSEGFLPRNKLLLKDILYYFTYFIQLEFIIKDTFPDNLLICNMPREVHFQILYLSSGYYVKYI